MEESEGVRQTQSFSLRGYQHYLAQRSLNLTFGSTLMTTLQFGLMALLCEEF